MFNPDIKIVKSKGLDIPIMKVYLIGRIAGNCMEHCLAWRKEIIEYYRDYKGRGQYPISFLCPLNSGESKTADALGLKSHISKNMIYDKDILSLKTSDVVVANMDDFMEVGIEDILEIPYKDFSIKNLCKDKPLELKDKNFDFENAYLKLREAILSRRPNLGSHYEVTVAIENKKPTILIAGSEKNKYILENHPFFSRASEIVLDIKELFEKKHLQILYKSMAGSTGEYE